MDIEFETHEYCTGCGEKLSKPFLVDSAPYSYNKVTGKPIFAWAKKCSEYDPRYFGHGAHDIVMTYRDEDEGIEFVQ
jgi:hypothetical protein